VVISLLRFEGVVGCFCVVTSLLRSGSIGRDSFQRWNGVCGKCEGNKRIRYLKPADNYSRGRQRPGTLATLIYARGELCLIIPYILSLSLFI